MELDKICRLCLTTKKDMRNIFTESIISMLESFTSVKFSRDGPGWPDKICGQCVNMISRCHSFKKRIERSDEQLKQYIKSLTVIVEETLTTKEIQQAHIKPQEIQIQRSDPQLQQGTPLIIANINPSAMLNGQQLIQTASGQIIQAQIGQFVQGPNTIQMITTSSTPQPQLQQLLQIRPEPELIVQQPEMNEPHHHQYYEEIPVYVQSANGQQTILNLPHHQVQALQQQQQQQEHQQQQHVLTSSSDTDEIEIQDIQNFDDDEYNCEEEVLEDETEQEAETESGTTTTTYYIQQEQIEIANVDQEETIDKKLLADFLIQHAIQESPTKFLCNLCQHEFKSMKCLENHMKIVHSNWIKANCKKQPTCQICNPPKSFRGPGMLKMHMKTHERENKMPTCSVCLKEFKSKSILYRHRSSHFSDQKHSCVVCNKIFNSNYQLNAHVARHHKIKHQCSDCEKCFNNATDLKNHQKEHLADGL